MVDGEKFVKDMQLLDVVKRKKFDSVVFAKHGFC